MAAMIHASDGRRAKQRQSKKSIELVRSMASIAPFYETPFFSPGDVVRYDSQRDAGHITGQGTIERVTYFNRFFFHVRVKGELLDFVAEDLQRVPVVALAVQRLNRIRHVLSWLLARWRGWIDRVLGFVLTWMQADIPLIIDHMVSIRPGYIIWRLSVEAQSQPELLPQPQVKSLPMAA